MVRPNQVYVRPSVGAAGIPQDDLDARERVFGLSRNVQKFLFRGGGILAFCGRNRSRAGLPVPSALSRELDDAVREDDRLRVMAHCPDAGAGRGRVGVLEVGHGG